MAEALARHYWAQTMTVASAGVSPLGYIPQETIQVLEEAGISTRGLRSKRIAEIEIEDFQLILNLAAYPLEESLASSFKGRVIHWNVRDPYRGNLDAFRQARNAIEWLVTEKLPWWFGEVADSSDTRDRA